jgi:hypothetical protein
MIFSIGPEALITSVVLLIAVLYPQLGLRCFRRAALVFTSASRRRKASVLCCGLLALLLRATLLPILPFPIPYIHDEFSHLLAADTFAHGRLTNPTPPMWIHFETLHVIFTPTYMSMYPPLQGLFLATGELVAGHPFWGVWLSVGLMCAAICWMLQAWVPPQWALIGGLLPALRFGVFVWGSTYWGGAPAAIGGALVMGALPRIVRHHKTRDSLLMALGAGLLANSRPYEGFLLGLTAATILVIRILRQQKDGQPLSVLLRRVILPLCGSLALVGVMTGYYFYRVTGSPVRMPIQVNRDMYSMGRYFYWQHPHAVPVYHHYEMRRFYENEFQRYEKHRSLAGFFWETGFKLILVWLFYVGPALTVPLFASVWALRDRRIRLLAITGAVGAVGMELVIYFAPQYSAPFTCIMLALLVQGLRHLRAWRWDGRPVGAFLAHSTIAVCVLMVPIQISVLWAQAKSPGWKPPGFGRQEMLDHLQSLPGKQLVLVQYRPDHDVLSEEWVYNEADIEHSKVVWARDMGEAGNVELLNHCKDRQVWLVQPDSKPPELLPYAAAAAKSGTARGEQ